MPRTAKTETTDEEVAAEAPIEEWEARRAALLAKLPPADKRPTNLMGKLALITSLVGEIKKTGENKFHNYKYVKEADLVEAIRPLMAELGIWLHQTLHWDPELGIVGHERRSQVRKDDTVAETLTVLVGKYTFYDAESGESTPPQLFIGYGDDTGDKGAYKALTGMEKYFLMKTFLVATGDDPEADERADKRAAGRDATTTVTVGKAPRGQAPAAHGGRQQQTSSAQLKAIGEVFRANGIKSAAAGITAVETIMATKIEVPDPAEPATALQAFLGSLSAEDAGRIIREVPNAAWRDIPSQTPPDGAAPETESAVSEPAPGAGEE